MSEVTLLYLAVAFVLLVLLFVLRKLLKGKPQLDQSVSQTERMFTPVLEKAVGGQYLLYCKVPVADVLQPSASISERAQRKALKPVQGRQFDYLVCDKTTQEVVCAVELDDHSYDKKSFKKQDLFLEDLCQSVYLPLLRVAPQNGYNLVEIIERFERTIAPAAPAEAPVYSAKFNLELCSRFEPQG